MNTAYQFISKVVLLAALMPLGTITANAGEQPEWRDWTMGDRFGIGIGAFKANLDTEISLGAEQLGNATVSIESDLGLKDAETRPLVDAYWRFAKRHQIKVQYFKLDRSSETILDKTIKLDGNEFPVNTDLQAFFDIENTSISYNYSFIFTEKHDLYGGIGLSWQDYSFGANGSAIIDGNPPIDAGVSASAAAPLPTLQLGYNWAFSPKWIWRTKLGGFGLDIDIEKDGKFDGQIYEFSSGIEWRAWKNLSIGASYDAFRVEVDIESDGVGGQLKYTYHGPKLFVWTHF